jgi:hypothetical protein
MLGSFSLARIDCLGRVWLLAEHYPYLAPPLTIFSLELHFNCISLQRRYWKRCLLIADCLNDERNVVSAWRNRSRKIKATIGSGAPFKQDGVILSNWRIEIDQRVEDGTPSRVQNRSVRLYSTVSYDERKAARYRDRKDRKQCKRRTSTHRMLPNALNEPRATATRSHSAAGASAPFEC